MFNGILMIIAGVWLTRIGNLMLNKRRRDWNEYLEFERKMIDNALNQIDTVISPAKSNISGLPIISKKSRVPSNSAALIQRVPPEEREDTREELLELNELLERLELSELSLELSEILELSELLLSEELELLSLELEELSELSEELLELLETNELRELQLESIP